MKRPTQRLRVVGRGSSRGGSRLVWVTVFLLSGFLLASLGYYCFRSPTRTQLSQTQPVAALRGEPINPIPQTNAQAPAIIDSRPPKRKRPQPASVQHRMVEYRVNQAAEANAQEAPKFGASPARVIFSPSQLAALPDIPLPTGYQRLGFDTLSAFPFEVTRAMAEGATNLAVTSAAAWPSIPAAVKALDNHLVAIRGFLLPVKMNNGLAFEFLLLRNQNMCCYGSVPRINEWITVQAQGEGVKPIMDQPITVMGRLHVGEIREQGYLVGLYRLDAEKLIGPNR